MEVTRPGDHQQGVRYVRTTTKIICAASLAAILLAGGVVAWHRTPSVGWASATTVAGESRSPEDSEIALSIRVEMDRARYATGEVIFVTLVNTLSDFISAPPRGPADCSNVEIQKLVAGAWVTQGFCDAGEVPVSITLDSKSMMTAALVREVRKVNGPYFSEPSAPGVTKGEPFAPPAPWQPGDLTVEVPEGDINVYGLLYGTRGLAFGPGSYRIAFTFTPGSAGSVQTVYSEVFIVEGPQ